SPQHGERSHHGGPSSSATTSPSRPDRPDRPSPPSSAAATSPPSAPQDCRRSPRRGGGRDCSSQPRAGPLFHLRLPSTSSGIVQGQLICSTCAGRPVRVYLAYSNSCLYQGGAM